MDESHASAELETPVWAAFADLMSGALGAFVLLLALALVAQLDLSERLQREMTQRQAETQRRQALERALAVPLASGQLSLHEGRIGIGGHLLFAPGSDELHPEGRALLQSLALPLAAYLRESDSVLMVSGFTDDRAVRGGNRAYADNWELSALRALSVTRSLIAQGLPAPAVFAAAFGPQRPVADNASSEGRTRNRRVELLPLPRNAPQGAGPGSEP